MPPSAPPRNHQVATSLIEAKWLASTEPRFFQLIKTALKWPPVSHTFCFAGIDPEKLHNVTYGSDEELEKALHDIYTEHGPVNLQVRGCDVDGNYYVKCSQPGNKYGPAKAVIRVSPANVEEGTTTAAKTEPSWLVVDRQVHFREDWDEVLSDEQVQVEDDWVKV